MVLEGGGWFSSPLGLTMVSGIPCRCSSATHRTRRSWCAVCRTRYSPSLRGSQRACSCISSPVGSIPFCREVDAGMGFGPFWQSPEHTCSEKRSGPLQPWPFCRRPSELVACALRSSPGPVPRARRTSSRKAVFCSLACPSAAARCRGLPACI